MVVRAMRLVGSWPWLLTRHDRESRYRGLLDGTDKIPDRSVNQW